MRRLIIIFCFTLTATVHAQKFKTIELSGDNGGPVKGESWNSSSMLGKWAILFYVDPDEKNLNEHVAEAIKARNYDRSKFNSYAIINMAATWKPNWIISEILKDKQRKFDATIYVKDKKKLLVKEWKLQDDSYHIVVMNKEGEVLYNEHGKIEGERLERLMGLLDQNLK